MMDIIRIINGKRTVVTLTEEEIEEAYCEQRHRYDKIDILDLINYYDNDEVILDVLGAPREFIEGHTDEIAYEARWLLCKYPYNDPENAFIDAIKSVYEEDAIKSVYEESKVEQ